jgi:hypothetical protein
LVVLVLVVAAAASMIVGFILGHIPCLGQILAFAIGLAVSVVAGAASRFIIPAIVVTAKAPVEALGDNVRFAQSFVTPALLLAAVHVALGMVGSLVCLVGLLVTMPVACSLRDGGYCDYCRADGRRRDRLWRAAPTACASRQAGAAGERRVTRLRCALAAPDRA